MRNVPPRTMLASILLLASMSAVQAGPQRDYSDGTVQISLSDWLQAQGTAIVAFQGRVSSKPFSALGNLGVVDYANTLALANHLSYGFSATGTVTVTKLADGTGQVRVNESFSNAICYAFNADGKRIFGYSAGELAGSNTTPALANGHLQAVYIVPDAMHPELDLFKVAFNGNTLSQLSFHSEASGALRAAFGVPEGTPGRCIEENTGLFSAPGGGATADAFPAEHVDVFATGGQALTSAGGNGAATSLGSRPTVIGSWGAIKALYHR